MTQSVAMAGTGVPAWLVAAAVVALSAIWLLVIATGGTKSEGRRRGKPKYRLPPGPKPWPVVGNLPALAKGGDDVQLDVKLNNLAKIYGPIMHLQLGSVPTVVISSPELAQVVLKEQDLVFATRPPAPYAVRELSSVEDGTPFAPYGPDWRFCRKLLTLELLTKKRIDQFQPVREEEINAMVRGIAHWVVTKGGSIDLLHPFRAVSLNTLTRITLGKRYVSQPGESDFASGKPQTDSDPEGKNRDMHKAVVGDTLRLVHTACMVGDVIPALSFLDKILQRGLRKEVTDTAASQRSFYQKMLEEHLVKNSKEQRAEDIMDVLLTLRESSGETLKDKRVKALVRTMISAGTDTTGMSLRCAMLELLEEPKYLHLAQQELDQVVGRDRMVEESDLPNLPLLRAIVKESWRLGLSGLLLPRYAMEDTQVGGYDIPANTTVLVNVRGISRDPAAWPEPDRFYPERFLERPDIDAAGGQHFQFLVFGSGRRSCPGANLGTVMVEITLARLLHSFNFSRPVEPHEASAVRKDVAWLHGTLMAVPSLRLPSHLY